MKRKLVALVVNLVVDVLLYTFSLVFRLKDDSPGIRVTNVHELGEALAREGPVTSPQTQRSLDIRKSVPCPSGDGPPIGHGSPTHYVSNCFVQSRG